MLKDIKIFLIGGIVLLLVAIAYLFGKVQTLSNVKVPQQSPQVQSVTTEAIPTPTTKTVVVYKTQPPIPTQAPERKKVSIYIDDSGGITKGTFYCYEDKVNELATLQNLIRVKDMSDTGCLDSARSQSQSCVSKCSNPDIDAFSACDKQCVEEYYSKCNSNAGDLRKDLFNKVQQYCP